MEPSIFSNLPNNLIMNIIKMNTEEELKIKNSYNYNNVLDQLEELTKYTLEYSYDEEEEDTLSMCLLEVIFDDNLERCVQNKEEEDFENYYN
jgi:hypothetical protein